jgi:hypothetical protein
MPRGDADLGPLWWEKDSRGDPLVLSDEAPDQSDDRRGRRRAALLVGSYGVHRAADQIGQPLLADAAEILAGLLEVDIVVLAQWHLPRARTPNLSVYPSFASQHDLGPVPRPMRYP